MTKIEKSFLLFLLGVFFTLVIFIFYKIYTSYPKNENIYYSDIDSNQSIKEENDNKYNDEKVNNIENSNFKATQNNITDSEEFIISPWLYKNAVKMLDARVGSIECFRWASYTYEDAAYILTKIQEEIAFTPFGMLPNIVNNLKELNIKLKRYDKNIESFLVELSGCNYMGVYSWESHYLKLKNKQ